MEPTPITDLAAGLRSILTRRQGMGLRRMGAGSSAPEAPSVPSEPAGPRPEIQTEQATQKQATQKEPTQMEPTRRVSTQQEPTQLKPTKLASPSDLAPRCLDMGQLLQATQGCRACELCESRKQVVFMDGKAAPGGVFFVGDAPGEQEDQRGLPFVGPSGQLLTDIIEKGMGLRRDQVSIAYVLKCHPPANRDPKPTEKALCTPFLDRQIELADPKVVILLGEQAAQHLLNTEQPISALRGRVHDRLGRHVVPTFHPDFLLRNPTRKRDCWMDIQLAMRTAGLSLPGK